MNVTDRRANNKLARAIRDVGFGMLRAQIEYKAKRHRTRLVISNRWYPGSRLRAVWYGKNEVLVLRDRKGTRAQRGTQHDRDHSAARDLKGLATETALSLASPSGNGDAVSGRIPGVAGKVTPVRSEWGRQGPPGQEMSCAHVRALS